jgi:DNA-binding response OmpR family regulator
MAPPRVLLVDDDADIRGFLATLLELEGMEPAFALSPEEALAEVTAASAVLVDVAMPGMDGLELCRLMRGTGYAGPILVLSARPGADLPHRASEAGATDFLRKPFDNAELVALLRRHLAASRAR